MDSREFFIENLPSALDGISSLVEDIVNERTVLMGLIIKLMLEQENYTLDMDQKDYENIIDYRLSISKTGDNSITVQVLFPAVM